jgi:hypothetical protein
MSQLGQQSIAHEYDSKGECIHCHAYKNVVATMSLECTPKREMDVDPNEQQADTKAILDNADDLKGATVGEHDSE